MKSKKGKNMIEILYDCPQFIVCIKPSGYISEASQNDKLSLPKAISEEKAIKNLYTVHRLDKDTEGVMVYAKTASFAAELSKQITDGTFKKEYITQVSGRPSQDEDMLSDLLFYDRARSKSYVVDRMRRGVKDARLEYSLLSYSAEKDISTLKIKLLTGRTHQIRVQLASRGLPVCGDKKYGSAFSVKPLRLYCSHISFLDANKNHLNFSSLPNWYDV